MGSLLAPALLPVGLVQNGDAPMTVTLLLVAGDRTTSSHAAVSSSMAVTLGIPGWQARLVDVVTSRAREGAVRLGSQLDPQGAPRDRRFVPLAAAVPSAHVTH
jgi:hypothetical protein